MKMTTSTTYTDGLLVYMYDHEMKSFVRRNRDADFITMTDDLILSSRRFLWNFDVIKDFGSTLLGYTIKKKENKFVLSIVYDTKEIQFRQDWVNALGKLFSKEYDFGQPLFLSYEDVQNEMTSISFEDEEAIP